MHQSECQPQKVWNEESSEDVNDGLRQFCEQENYDNGDDERGGSVDSALVVRVMGLLQQSSLLPVQSNFAEEHRRKEEEQDAWDHFKPDP